MNVSFFLVSNINISESKSTSYFISGKVYSDINQGRLFIKNMTVSAFDNSRSHNGNLILRTKTNDDGEFNVQFSKNDNFRDIRLEFSYSPYITKPVIRYYTLSSSHPNEPIDVTGEWKEKKVSSSYTVGKNYFKEFKECKTNLEESSEILEECKKNNGEMEKKYTEAIAQLKAEKLKEQSVVTIDSLEILNKNIKKCNLAWVSIYRIEYKDKKGNYKSLIDTRTKKNILSSNEIKELKITFSMDDRIEFDDNNLYIILKDPINDKPIYDGRDRENYKRTFTLDNDSVIYKDISNCIRKNPPQELIVLVYHKDVIIRKKKYEFDKKERQWKVSK